MSEPPALPTLGLNVMARGTEAALLALIMMSGVDPKKDASHAVTSDCAETYCNTQHIVWNTQVEVVALYTLLRVKTKM